MDCSPGSPCSAGSPPEQANASEVPSWVVPLNEGTSALAHSHIWLARHSCDASPVCSPPEKPQAFPEPKPEEAAAVSDSLPETKTPAAVEVKEEAAAAAAPPTLPALEEVAVRPSISLDTILNQEVHSLTSDIKNLMQTHRICYTSQLPPRLPPRHSWQPNSCFSDFVVSYVAPVPVQGHVKALCEKMDKLIPAPPAPPKVASPPPAVTSHFTAAAAVQTSKPKAEPCLLKSATPPQSGKAAAVKETATASAKVKAEAASAEMPGELHSPAAANSPEATAQNPGSAPGGGSGLLADSLIGQLKPEVFSSLVEIFKDVTKNTVKFYIYEGDENEVCKEIKVRHEVKKRH